MLEKPDLSDEKLIACLKEHYSLAVDRLDFLPLGADRNTAVYRATEGQTAYFVKLRWGDFDDITLLVPKLLHDSGVAQVIALIVSRHGLLATALADFHLLLYPFVEGSDGLECDLSAAQWVEVGRVLRQIHGVSLPAPVLERIPSETFSPYWRERVREFCGLARLTKFDDPVAAALAALLQEKGREIGALLDHAERLAEVLQTRDLPFVVCHADIHAGNVHITPAGDLYVVDWDTMILAPKERDLMFAGIGFGSAQFSADEQAAFFLQGYGPTDVDAAALAYYRCERIVQDVYEYCLQILFTEGESADRRNGLEQLRSQFEPGVVVDRAFLAIEALPPGLG